MIAYNELMTREPPFQDGRDCCLFLDIDGTLLDIAPTPDAVRVDQSLRDLLRSLEHACHGALALISGRTIPDIDDLFEPLFLPVAGVHGGERRDGLGYWHRHARRTPEFDSFCGRLHAELAPFAGVIVEDKQISVALHYRLVPEMEVPLRKLLHRLKPEIPASHEILEGNEVIELKPRASNKGDAIDAFMHEKPFAGRFPIFVGDDLTDEHGFDAVRRRGGLAVAVGSNVHSEWTLSNPDRVRRWLTAFVSRRMVA